MTSQHPVGTEIANTRQLSILSEEELAETAFALFDTLCQVGGARMGTQALTLLYAEEADAAAAGLDWSLLDGDEDGCGCGGHDGGCCGGHGHEDGHECCGGHHDGEGHGHGEGCCGGHGEGHGHGHGDGGHHCCCHGED